MPANDSREGRGILIRMSPTPFSRMPAAIAKSGMPVLRGRAFGLMASIPARSLLGLIWLYRHSLSPVLPVVCGPGCGCRFHPTCAAYAAEAVRTHGAVRGSWLTVRRLLKCHPWHPGGLDPVPPSHFRAALDDTVSSTAEPARPVAPVLDWRGRRSKTGATPGCGINRGRKYMA